MEARSPRAGAGGLVQAWRREWFLAVAVVAASVFLAAGEPLWARAAGPGMLLGFAVLFAVILGSALAVVRHAEHLADRLGEPFGTIVLTLAVTSIEVIAISAVMLHGENNPTLVRDSLLSVVMIILNGMVGLALLIGAWRHHEQSYNLQGANTYLGVILPLAVLNLVLPTYTTTTEGPTLSLVQGGFLALMSASLYVVFLAVQASRHRSYFVAETWEEPEEPVRRSEAPVLGSTLLLLAYMAPVVVLAEQMAYPIDYLVETRHAPAGLGGLAIAALIATPEAIGAVQGARANHLQRSVNISLGSMLATIGLTVPAMIVVSAVTKHPILLGVQGVDMVMLLLTLAVSVVTFASGRTNVLQGLVHLLLLAAYLLLMVEG